MHFASLPASGPASLEAPPSYNASEEAQQSASFGRFDLNMTVEDEGANFSAGEGQLIALGRALVKGSKIVVMVSSRAPRLVHPYLVWLMLTWDIAAARTKRHHPSTL